MTQSRTRILEGIRRAHGRGPLPDDQTAVLAAGLANPVSRLTPKRGQGTPAEVRTLFETMATAVSATLDTVGSWAEVPGVLVEFLKARNLPSEVAAAPDARLDVLAGHDLLTVRRGPALPQDLIGVSVAFKGVAETGTLMLVSGPDTPTSLNFLPDVHVVCLETSQLGGTYEQAWAALRAAYPDDLPRTVNFITGPSRTGDIEQTIQLGAHGPRQLHIILVDDQPVS